jgi:hypothetical protein
MIRRFLPSIAILGALLAPAAVHADSPVTAGGWTDEACTGQGANTALVVTPSSAYTANNEVGPLLTLNFARSPTSHTGIMQSVTLTSKSVQTAEFDVTFLISAPSVLTAFADKTGPSIAAADVGLVRGPIKLTNNWSALGTHTVYNQDQIARAVRLAPNNSQQIYAVITTPGTPTFTTASDLQLCVAELQD